MNYDEINEFNNNSVLNDLTSALKNIDIDKITSLLNTLGIFNNSNNNNKTDVDQKYNDGNIINDTELAELFKQASAVNDMIVNNNNENKEDYNKENYVEVYENDKKKKHKPRKEKNVESESEDEIVKLLNAIKSMVIEEKREIIDKIIELYIKGEI